MSIPFALSLSKYVNSAGTDVGFASLLAVALLILLYFAGARETRTLRDQLEDAHNRITSLEARVAQALRNQGARGAAPQNAPQVTQMPTIAGRPGVVPPPSVAQPMGTAVARVQREASATAGAAAAAAAVLLGAPAGAGAPALGSATTLIPAPVGVPVPAVPVSIPAVTAAAGAPTVHGTFTDDDEDDDFAEDYQPGDTMFVPAAAGAMTSGGRSGGGGVAAPPRVQFGGGQAPEGPPPRRTIPTVDTGPSRPRRFAGRLVGLIAAVVVVAIVVVVLLAATGGSSKKTGTTARANSTPTPTTTKRKTAVAFNPKSVKVSVLNGTGVGGLAGDVGTDLTSSGYTVPAVAVTNAAVQTVDTTEVMYRTGYKTAALKVAQALEKTTGVVITTIEPATQAAITSCGTPDDGGAAGTCPADVIVTVGTDLDGAASSGTGA